MIEKISTLTNSAASRIMQTTSPNKMPSDAMVNDRPVKRSSGELSDLCHKFSLREAARFAKDPERCVTGVAPSLIDLDTTYGPDAARYWLAAQLADLSEYCGVKGKLSPCQIDLCVTNILQEYDHLKVTELLLYFSRIALGRYGLFYNQVDPQRINSWLARFMEERRQIIARKVEREDSLQQAREEEERKGKTVTYDEYLQMKAEGKI